MTKKYVVKRGETFTLLGTLTVGGVVTSTSSVLVTAKARSKNSDAAPFAFAYQSLEVDLATKGKFKLTLNTSAMPTTQYDADVKYVMPDTTVFFDETFEIEVSETPTRT